MMIERRVLLCLLSPKLQKQVKSSLRHVYWRMGKGEEPDDLWCSLPMVFRCVGPKTGRHVAEERDCGLYGGEPSFSTREYGVQRSRSYL